MRVYRVTQDAIDEVFALRKSGLLVKQIVTRNSYGLGKTVVVKILGLKTRTMEEYDRRTKDELKARKSREGKATAKDKLVRKTIADWKNEAKRWEHAAKMFEICGDGMIVELTEQGKRIRRLRNALMFHMFMWLVILVVTVTGIALQMLGAI